MVEEIDDQETHVQLRSQSNKIVGLHKITFFQVLHLILRFLKFLKLLHIYIIWGADHLFNFCLTSFKANVSFLYRQKIHKTRDSLMLSKVLKEKIN